MTEMVNEVKCKHCGRVQKTAKPVAKDRIWECPSCFMGSQGF